MGLPGCFSNKRLTIRGQVLRLKALRPTLIFKWDQKATLEVGSLGVLRPTKNKEEIRRLNPHLDVNCKYGLV